MKDIFDLSPFADFDDTSQDLYRQSVELRAKARNLPGFLRFCDIAILLGYEPTAYFHFIWTEPLDFHPVIDQSGVPFTLEARLISNTIPFSLSAKYGTHKEQFKQYLSGRKQWPICDRLLANWWADEGPEMRQKHDSMKCNSHTKELLTQGDHISKKLMLLIEAANKFWGNADPGDRLTHDTNAKVANWLMENGFTNKEAAENGANIIRPEWAAKGRR